MKNIPGDELPHYTLVEIQADICYDEISREIQPGAGGIMVELHLDREETIVLTNMLDECIQELRGEIVRTERFDYRQMLKTREALLKKILQQIRSAQETPVAV
jgi:hypothetical protein